LVLDIFRTTFPICQDYEALKVVLKEVREVMVERDFERAFGRKEWLEAYAVRWSPNRALCFATVILGMCEEFKEDVWVQQFIREEEDGGGEASKSTEIRRPLKVVCFGGGAAEIMAFGVVLRHIRPQAIGKPISTCLPPNTMAEGMNSLSISEGHVPIPDLDLHLVDAANWDPVISSLQNGLITPPTLSKYASASAKANNASFISPHMVNTSFQQINILEASQEESSNMLGTEPALITLFFTLSELYKTSIAKAAAFLLKLTLAAPKDSLLLIVDSPDSEPALEKDENGKQGKKYPMHYLLDLVLMEKGLGKKPAWEKLVEDQNRLFRMEEGLKYPVGLENFRFQRHLFKKG